MNLKKKIYLLAVLFAFACGGNEEMQEEKNPEEESAGELTEEVFFEYDLAEDGAEESTEINKANKPRIQKPYYMRIHDGNFLSKTGYDKFEHTTAEDLTYSLDYWEDNDTTKPLLIYAHGGLVGANTAVHKPYKDKFHQLMKNKGIHPFYVVYGAGIAETTEYIVDDIEGRVKDGFKQIKEDGFFLYVFDKVKRLFQRKSRNEDFEIDKMNEMEELYFFDVDKTISDIKTGAGEDEIDWDSPELDFTEQEIEEFTAELFEDPNFQKELDKGRVMDEYEIKGLNQIEKMDIAVVGKVIALYQIVKGIVSRFRKNRDHGLWCTFFEEFVDHSKLKIFGMINLQKWLNKYIEAIWRETKDNVARGFATEESAGTKLAYELVNRKGEVTLSGSSTGAIFVCELIKKMDEIKLNNPDAYKDLTVKVIMVVPACRFTLFESTFRNTQIVRQENIMVMNLTDKKEKDGINFVLYPRSTLYLVSGIAEGEDTFNDMPILGMERFFIEKGRQQELTDDEERAIGFAYDYLKYGQEDSRIIHSCFPQNGEDCPVYTHNGVMHVGVINDKLGMNTIANFTLHGYDNPNEDRLRTGN